MSIRIATPADRTGVLRLLRASDLPTLGVDEAMEGFFVAEAADRGSRQVVGAAGLEVHGRHGLLRSLAVAPEHRDRGLGGALVRKVLEEARSRELDGVYLLTTTADHYFLGHGFGIVDRASAPDPVQASVEFSEACPATAVCMLLEL